MTRTSLGLAALVLAAVSTAWAQPTPRPVGEVAYVHAERVYVALAPDAGVEPGSELVVRSRAGKTARVEVVEVLPQRAIARLLEPAPWLRTGDAVSTRAPVPPPHDVTSVPPPPATAALGPTRPSDTLSWTDQPYPKVDAGRPAKGPPLATMRTSAALRGAAWLYLDHGGADYQRDSLELMAYGAIDEAGDFLLDVDMRLTGQLVVAGDARDRALQTAYFDIYRANVTYMGLDPFWLAVGRRPISGLRWGLLDGAAAGWRFAEGQTLEVALGVRPDAGSLWPEHFHPVANLDVSGSGAWDSTRFGYRVGASWLGGDQMATDSLESAAALTLDLFGWLGLDAEAGILATFPANGAATLSLDHATVGASARIADLALLRLSGRRLEGWGPLAEQTLLPVGTYAADPRWDLAGYGDLFIGQWGAAALEASAGGGVIWDETRGETRGWTEPALVLRLAPFLGAWLRVGYRLEVGATGGQLGEVAVGLEPMPDLRIDLWQQAGVWALTDTRVVLPTGSTWLRLTWRPIAWLEIAVRGRALYGDAGTAFEVDGQVAAVDFW